LSYAYSNAGLLLMMQDSDGNRTDYDYDPTGRLTGIWAPNNDYTAFAYDDDGRLIEKWLPNGVNTQYSYNRDNTLKQVVNRHGVGITISQHDYTYDGVGNRITHNELINGTTNPYTYAYDALNRLTTVTNTSTSTVESYAYDPLGNRSTKTAGGSTLAYVYDTANQLTEIRQTSITGTLLGGLVYDNNGNLTKKCESGTVTVSSSNCSGTTVTDLTHDTFNRLAQVDKTGISTQTYKYDDSGRRIQKVNGSTITNYLYNSSQIVDQYDNNWSLNFNYTYGPGADAPTIRASSTTTQYYHQNGIGNVVAVTNQTGATDGAASYDPWGNLTSSSGTIPTYGFTGREPDETGLVFFRARYYDPTIGRFVSRDPLGLRGGINFYAYVGNSPTNLVDPEGQAAFFWHGWVTYNVARERGNGILDSLSFAWNAMKPDLNIFGTWSNSQDAQTIHAAGGAPPKGEQFLSPSQVVDAARSSATANFGSPNVSNQMTGIHTVQDIPVHQGEPLIPAETPWWKVPLVIGEHILNDVFVSSEVKQQMYEETRKGFATIESNNNNVTIDIDPHIDLHIFGNSSGGQSMGSFSPISR
jgi:RHS repeat-associated protein